MIEIPQIDIDQFLQDRENAPVVDVRTPAEFAVGHVPGAINIPLFSNEERKIVGTLYKQRSREQAVLKGLELIGPKMKKLALQARGTSREKKVMLYCWRGGLRSYSFAWMLKLYGLQVKTIKGGYKAYRRYLKQELGKPANIWILGGLTGSGKTDKLRALEELGEQIIDLEKLAHHKGSAFGRIGEDKQSHNEQFENDLGEAWLQIDRDKPLWIEDEGKSIGCNYIPDELFNQMKQSPVLEVSIPQKDRIRRLMDIYTHTGHGLLIGAVQKIEKRLGGKNTKEAVEAIKNNNLQRAIEIVLHYYDKAYRYGLGKRDPKSIFTLNLEKSNAVSNAKEIKSFQIEINKRTRKW